MSAWAARLWAVARCTLLEAVRRRVFVVLVFFGAALVSATLFFPAVGAEGRLRLTQAWSLRAASLFTAIVALFLAGFSLPTDFEQRRIYLLVVKPVSKSLVFLGRFVGYALLLSLFVGVLAVTCALFMRAVSWFGGKDFPPLAAYPRDLARSIQHQNGQVVQDRGEELVAVASGGLLIWNFENLPPKDFDGPIRVLARLVVGSPVDKYRVEGKVLVRVRGAGGVRDLPDVAWNSNEERELSVPREILGADGRLDVLLEPADPDGFIAGSLSRMTVFRKSSLFELAYLRGMGLVLLQSLIVLATTLSMSTFCTAPLSIVLGVLMFAVGVTHGALADGVRDIGVSVKEQEETGRRTGVTQEVPPFYAKAALAVSRAVLALVPDFGHFDYSRWLLKDLEVSWREMGRAARRALPPVLVLVLLGMLVMRMRGFEG